MADMMARGWYNFALNNLNQYQGNYLEIGIFGAIGLASLAGKYRDKTIYGVDPFIEDGYTSATSGLLKGNQLCYIRELALSRAEPYSNIKIFEQSSIDFNKNLTADLIKELGVSCVFIDGNHHYDFVKNDAELAMKLIADKSGGICFDDVTIPGVEQAFNQFQHIYKDRIIEMIDVDLSTKLLQIKQI